MRLNIGEPARIQQWILYSRKFESKLVFFKYSLEFE